MSDNRIGQVWRSLLPAKDGQAKQSQLTVKIADDASNITQGRIWLCKVVTEASGKTPRKPRQMMVAEYRLQAGHFELVPA